MPRSGGVRYGSGQDHHQDGQQADDQEGQPRLQEATDTIYRRKGRRKMGITYIMYVCSCLKLCKGTHLSLY